MRLRHVFGIGRSASQALLGAAVVCGGLVAASGTQDAFAVGETRSLRMVHAHTGEAIAITYKSGGSFDSSALEKLNWFLRDWRVDEPISMSPHLFDVVWHVYREVGASEPIKIMSAYRSPGTNAMLRRRSRAVAKESQHMRGNAMDIHIPGVSMARAREIGLRLQRGGVGYYPSAGSPFVHLDVGSVRHWPKIPREQLERIFPDGKTVHIPADGKPLANYEAALAEVQARGGSALDYATVTSNSGKSLWALLFGGGEEEEEVAPVRGRGRGATRVADARGARGAPSSVTAFAGNADNPMNPGVAAPVEPARAAPRPVVVAALPEARVEPPRLPETRAADAPKAEDKARYAVVAGLPMPPIRPRGAAFAQLVASTEPYPLPPARPAGLGGAPATFSVASASPTPAPAAPAAAPAPAMVAAVGMPLPPQRPASSLPSVVRPVEEKAAAAPVQAYAAVSAPLPPQRAPALNPSQRASAPAALRPQPAAVQAPRPALEAGRADPRASGQRPLAVPAVVAAKEPQAPKAAGSMIGQGFTAQKHLPSLGFSGSFVRELDAAGTFRRLGQ